MTFARLQTVDPELVEALRAAAPDTLRKVSHRVATTAVQHTGLDSALIAEALAHTGGETSAEDIQARLTRLVDELDERAWDLQDRAEEGAASQQDYLKAFAAARAAAAVLNHLSDDPEYAALEATYEAQAATGDIAPIRVAAHTALAES